jgi:hypothetical protein
MSLPVIYARKVLSSVEGRPFSNFVSQLKSKQLLLQVGELSENLPQFSTRLEDRGTFIAYRMLAAGCSLIESQFIDEGYEKLHRAGDLIESIHRESINQSESSAFHCLIGALTFYASGHYSRGFILIRRLEKKIPLAGVLSAFLKKDRPRLLVQLTRVLAVDLPKYNRVSEIEIDALHRLIAQAVANISEHSIVGDAALLDAAEMNIKDALLLSSEGSCPSYWWLSRLLKLLLADYQNGSLWTTLPSYFENEEEPLRRYIQMLACSSPPVTELWESQLTCLDLALDFDNKGGVVNLRTSAGKTRVAELAILKTLERGGSQKVIYLAPFRSLAFELERGFCRTLGALGYSVSHLYGGSRFSGVDRAIVQEADLLIATPEKVKAMLRADPELFGDVKLVVIDEGHLLGGSDRDVRNEIFIEHLRLLCRENAARMLLLSAVLPNASELAHWIGGNDAALARSKWKPSDERFGRLFFYKDSVQLEWKGKSRCFNPNFVEFRRVTDPKTGKTRKFPKNKTEGVAATAVRLSKLGPVLIFAGQARWVPSMAEAVILALGEDTDFIWPDLEWRLFEAVCIEEMGGEAPELRAARVGVICHSNRLPPQVRMALERLMAIKTPRVIIATTTLGQGVNIGVTSVIFSQTLIGKNRWISTRDFWNICGRAGRAFIDGEGKVLFAIDCTAKDLKVRQQKRRATKYLNPDNLNKVESGLLQIVSIVTEIAEEAGVSFEVLLELISSDEVQGLASESTEILEKLDLIDDQLLALHVAYRGTEVDADNVDWVEVAFLESLAAIQEANSDEQGRSNALLPFLRARTLGVLKSTPSSSARRAIVACGLPLSVANRAFLDLDFFRAALDEYIESNEDFDGMLQIIEKLESWIRDNAKSLFDGFSDSGMMDEIRKHWLSGESLILIQERSGVEALAVCTQFYGFQLPWLCHALAQNFDAEAEERYIEIFNLLGLLLEVGVPSESAAKVFLAGVRSRAAATELGAFVTDSSASPKHIRNSLLKKEIVEQLEERVSAETFNWIELFVEDETEVFNEFPHVDNFKVSKAPEEVLTLYSRSAPDGGGTLLCSLDGRYFVKVKSTESLPFDQVADDHRISFVREDDYWTMSIRDPRLKAEPK